MAGASPKAGLAAPKVGTAPRVAGVVVAAGPGAGGTAGAEARSEEAKEAAKAQLMDVLRCVLGGGWGVWRLSVVLLWCVGARGRGVGG